MVNKSYCRCENTLKALNEVLEALEGFEVEEEKEKKAAVKLLYKAYEYLYDNELIGDTKEETKKFIKDYLD